MADREEKTSDKRRRRIRQDEKQELPQVMKQMLQEGSFVDTDS
jgi:hypothetical protein